MADKPKEEEKGIESKIFDMEDEVTDMYSSSVIYAPEGIGKTTLTSYAPGLFWIDCEDGRSSIVKTANRPRVFEASSVDELTEIYLWLKANEEKFDSVAIDTYTEVEKWFLTDSIQQRAKKDPDKDPDMPTLPDYGKTAHRMSKLTRAFKGLNMNKFYICHERTDKDESTGVVQKAPALLPSVMKDLNGYVDMIFYLFIKDGVRYVRTMPTRNVRAKHRIGELPDVIELGSKIEDCSIARIMEMINKTKVKKEKKGDKKAKK